MVGKKNFHTDRQTDTHTHTHTRHPDWLSRASQHARGATKNSLIKAFSPSDVYSSFVCVFGLFLIEIIIDECIYAFVQFVNYCLFGEIKMNIYIIYFAPNRIVMIIRSNNADWHLAEQYCIHCIRLHDGTSPR